MTNNITEEYREGRKAFRLAHERIRQKGWNRSALLDNTIYPERCGTDCPYETKPGGDGHARVGWFNGWLDLRAEVLFT